MASVDAPPGIAFAGQAAGVFVARPRARKLANRVFVYVCFVSALTFFVAVHRLYLPLHGFLLMVPLMCFSVACLGFAVRSARLRVDPDGVRWGWRWGGFRMARDRMRAVNAYRDAFAFTPKRGSTWYVSRRDWDRFDRVPKAMRRAKIPFESHDGPAPFLARLQSYGIVLDLLLLADAFAVTFALLAAALV